MILKNENLISAFTHLGHEFLIASSKADENPGDRSVQGILTEAMENARLSNPWFIPDFVRFAYTAWAEALQHDKIQLWLADNGLPEFHESSRLNIGIIMAGNIPMVGLHDLLCVLASGHNALIRLSSADTVLMKAVIRVLCDIDPAFRERINITEGPLKSADAIIATGSNNTSRYFDYYFGKYPHIIRKNRNGTAVLTGKETTGELQMLADDVFMYFGLGCRNISKIYSPEGFHIEDIFPNFNKYAFLGNMHKYRNNYDYQKSILLINKVPHLDNGFTILKNDHAFISPVSVVHTEAYTSVEQVREDLTLNSDRIQCIVTRLTGLENTVPFGSSQKPELWDYADGVDTMGFLLELRKNKGKIMR